MSAAASKPPPSQPDEPTFKAFVTRLLRVPKEEIEGRERARVKRGPPAAPDGKVK